MLDVKFLGSTQNPRLKLFDWRFGGASGIPGVAVKCVDIWRNTDGEGSLLDKF